MYNIAVAGK